MIKREGSEAGMPDLEKVIKGLHKCTEKGFDCGVKKKECPYYDWHDEEAGTGDCIDILMADALTLLKEDERAIKFQSDRLDALLKAQEPVEPIMHYVPDGKRSSAAWQCGNCLIDIGYGTNYCYNCGQAVKW